jgi:hypothetical protein
MFRDHGHNTKVDVYTTATSPAFQFFKNGADPNSLIEATFFFRDNEKNKIGLLIHHTASCRVPHHFLRSRIIYDFFTDLLTPTPS